MCFTTRCPNRTRFFFKCRPPYTSRCYATRRPCLQKSLGWIEKTVPDVGRRVCRQCCGFVCSNKVMMMESAHVSADIGKGQVTLTKLPTQSTDPKFKESWPKLPSQSSKNLGLRRLSRTVCQHTVPLSKSSSLAHANGWLTHDDRLDKGLPKEWIINKRRTQQ